MMKIDAVITWVDGNDPKHKIKRASYEQKQLKATIPSSKEITRFVNNGELQYCLTSLLKNAAWIRNIYIVTDNQIPDFLPDKLLKHPKIKIVDHSIIFKGYENVLPTFNSITIESFIHRIPDLSEKYIYLNDDFIILQPVGADEFFLKNKVVLRGRWQRIQKYTGWRLALSQVLNIVLKKMFNINRSMSLLQQMKAAELAGYEKEYFKSPHYPHPQKKSTIERYYIQNRNIFLENIKYRFRNLNQHVAVFLSNHLEIKQNKAILKSDNDCLMICFNRDSNSLIQKKINLLKDKKHINFLCIQSFEESNSDQRNDLISILEEEYCLNQDAF